MPNNNYILTSSGSFLSEDELYHHGILGMKWGVRKRIYDSYSGMQRRVRGSKAYDRVTNSKVGQKVQSGYANVRKSSRSSASTQLKRYNGNTKIAMASTAVKSFGSAAAVNVGGRVVSSLLAVGSAAAAANGHVGIGLAGAGVSNAVRRGTRTASAVMAGYGAMKLSDVYRQGKNYK